MDYAGGVRLSTAGLAHEQDRGIQRRHAADLLHELRHRGRCHQETVLGQRNHFQDRWPNRGGPSRRLASNRKKIRQECEPSHIHRTGQTIDRSPTQESKSRLGSSSPLMTTIGIAWATLPSGVCQCPSRPSDRHDMPGQAPCRRLPNGVKPPLFQIHAPYEDAVARQELDLRPRQAGHHYQSRAQRFHHS